MSDAATGVPQRRHGVGCIRLRRHGRHHPHQDLERFGVELGPGQPDLAAEGSADVAQERPVLAAQRVGHPLNDRIVQRREHDLRAVGHGQCGTYGLGVKQGAVEVNQHP